MCSEEKGIVTPSGVFRNSGVPDHPLSSHNISRLERHSAQFFGAILAAST
jgi:hypothetical protein